MLDLKKLPNKHSGVPLRYAQGHFATNHSHINYYIDITYQKTRLSEAKAVAKALVPHLIPPPLWIRFCVWMAPM